MPYFIYRVPLHIAHGVGDKGHREKEQRGNEELSVWEVQGGGRWRYREEGEATGLEAQEAKRAARGAPGKL